MINLYRYLGNNLGDNLSTYLTRKISGQEVRNVNVPPKGEPVYGTIGSILEWIPPFCDVWGLGYMREQSRVAKKPFTIHAVRGKLTRQHLIEQGFDCPEVYGDPALLLPRYYTPRVEKRYELGVVPHYVDWDLPELEFFRKRSGALMINVRDDVETVIDNINKCGYIISSSLHGLIVADAYGIPCQWKEWSDNVVGKGFKFRDYFTVRDHVDLDKLMAACPFKEIGK